MTVNRNDSKNAALPLVMHTPPGLHTVWHKGHLPACVRQVTADYTKWSSTSKTAHHSGKAAQVHPNKLRFTEKQVQAVVTLENLLRIRPMGVVSKKVMGALIRALRLLR